MKFLILLLLSLCIISCTEDDLNIMDPSPVRYIKLMTKEIEITYPGCVVTPFKIASETNPLFHVITSDGIVVIIDGYSLNTQYNKAPFYQNIMVTRINKAQITQ